MLKKLYVDRKREEESFVWQQQKNHIWFHLCNFSLYIYNMRIHQPTSDTTLELSQLVARDKTNKFRHIHKVQSSCSKNNNNNNANIPATKTKHRLLLLQQQQQQQCKDSSSFYSNNNNNNNAKFFATKTMQRLLQQQQQQHQCQDSCKSNKTDLQAHRRGTVENCSKDFKYLPLRAAEGTADDWGNSTRRVQA